MTRQGSETNKFEHHIFDGVHPEKPMGDGDSTGAPTKKRYDRELAFRAWKQIAKHDSAQPLPNWIADYLQEVATKLLGDLGPLGGLSPASAHAALGLVGEQWPRHHPESVYHIIQCWLQPTLKTHKAVVDGRKAGAVLYIKEYMDNDPDAQVSTVIEWYKKGQRAHKKHFLKDERETNLENLVEFDQMIAKGKIE